MNEQQQLEAAEERLRVAQNAVRQATAEHIEAATHAQMLEQHVRAADPNSDPAGYARRMRDWKVAEAECSRLHAVIQVAERDVERARLDARGPRAALWNQEASAFAAASARIRTEVVQTSRGLAALLAVTVELRKAVLQAERHKARMHQLEQAGIAYAVRDIPTAEQAATLRTGHELLQATKINADVLSDREALTTLIDVLRGHLGLPVLPLGQSQSLQQQIREILAGTNADAVPARSRTRVA